MSNSANWGNPWKTLCQESEISLEIDGGAGALEFRSGATASPYLYTGFRAVVQFIHTGALVPPTLSTPSSILPKLRSETGRIINVNSKIQRRPPASPSLRRTIPPPIMRNGYDDDDEKEDDEDEDDEEYTDEPNKFMDSRAPGEIILVYFYLEINPYIYLCIIQMPMVFIK